MLDAVITEEGVLRIAPNPSSGTARYALSQWWGQNRKIQFVFGGSQEPSGLMALVPHAASQAAKQQESAPEKQQEPAPEKQQEEPVGETTTSEATDKREEVKARLDELGVKYNNRCRTETLEKLAAEAETKLAKTEPLPEPDDDPLGLDADEPSEPDVFEPISAEDFRELVKNFAASHGTERAKQVLAEFGAAKISELSDTQRAEAAVMYRKASE